jgi:His-Xaa-Ser system protein HxsD
MNNIEYSGDYLKIVLNPELYSLEAIYMASYQMSEKAYFVIDGDLADKIFLWIKPKVKEDLKTIAWEFNNQLLSSQVYEMMSKKNSKIKDLIIEKALEKVENEEPKEE